MKNILTIVIVLAAAGMIAYTVHTFQTDNNKPETPAPEPVAVAEAVDPRRQGPMPPPEKLPGEDTSGESETVPEEPEQPEYHMPTYGLLLSLEGTAAMSRAQQFDIAVIDAQNLSADQISKIHDAGTAVYSYLNIGSLESFRPYSGEYMELAMSPYEGWEGEYWIDVSSTAWKDKVLELAGEMALKGVDGFFVDNCDVYYQYPNPDIFQGLTLILRKLKAMGYPVIVNGGDSYVSTFLDKYRRIDNILDGVNQENVFTQVEDVSKRFVETDQGTRQYFMDYLDRVSGAGAMVYLTEYTRDEALAAQIDAYCREKNFSYYVADSLELN